MHVAQRRDEDRPGDDPDQTPWHFGFRFIWFWCMPLFVVGGAFLWVSILQDVVGGAELTRRQIVLLPGYPVGVVAWITGLVGYFRAKRRGETPIPGSYKPKPPPKYRGEDLRPPSGGGFI
jgi:hypothetical protein